MNDREDIPKRIRRRIATLPHALGRLTNACLVLQRRAKRGTLGDPALEVWLRCWARSLWPDTKPPALRVAVEGQSWRVLVDGLNDEHWTVALMLLHLPALRKFWRTSMRAQRWERLRRVMPLAWPMDPAPLPPGSLIHGLNIASWDELPKIEAAGRTFEAIECGGLDIVAVSMLIETTPPSADALVIDVV